MHPLNAPLENDVWRSQRLQMPCHKSNNDYWISYWNLQWVNLTRFSGLLDFKFAKTITLTYTVSEGKVVFFNLVLTERNMQVEFDLKLSVYSLGVDI